MKTILCLLLLIIIQHFALAGIAVTPGHDDTVNYTHVLFELPYNRDAYIYEVRIYPPGEGAVITGESFNNAVLVTSGLAFIQPAAGLIAITTRKENSYSPLNRITCIYKAPGREIHQCTGTLLQ